MSTTSILTNNFARYLCFSNLMILSNGYFQATSWKCTYTGLKQLILPPRVHCVHFKNHLRPKVSHKNSNLPTKWVSHKFIFCYLCKLRAMFYDILKNFILFLFPWANYKPDNVRFSEYSTVVCFNYALTTFESFYGFFSWHILQFIMLFFIIYCHVASLSMFFKLHLFQFQCVQYF